jgi:hypothetical protein
MGDNSMMSKSSTTLCFIVINALFMASTVIAVVYTFVKSLLLLAVLKKRQPSLIEKFDLSGWDSVKAMRLLTSGIGDDDPNIASMKRDIRVSQRVVLVSILCCFIGFAGLGIFMYCYGSAKP